MSSLTYETKTRTGYRLRSYDAADSRRRHSIWLGDISQREAETIKRHVEAVIESQQLGTPMPGETQRWLGKVPDALRLKLSGILGTARTASEAIAEYVKWSMRNNAQATVASVECTLDQFANQFGRLQMRSLVAEDIDRWLDSRNVVKNTMGKHAKTVKAWLAWCKQQGYIDDLRLKTSSNVKSGKKQFIGADLFATLLAGVRDPQDRCALAMARWSGIRVPSELVVRSDDVDFEDLTITYVDWKRTKRCNRGPPVRRITPLFPELLPFIEAVWLQRTEFLLPAIGDGGGVAFAARIRAVRDRLGLTWPRLFHSLRATRETELIAQFSMRAATEWIGNSPDVASEFYELITDETWERAKGKRGRSSTTDNTEIAG